MGIELPRARLSAPPQLRRRNVPTEAILEVLGNNPIAGAIDQGTAALSKAIQRRAEIRRQGEQLAALGRAVGADEGAFSGLSPEGSTLVASSLLKRKEDEAKRSIGLERIQRLEQAGGFKPGELGDDFDAAKLIFTQRSIGGRQDKSLGEKEDNQFKARINNQKNRMVNDPRIKPLYAQDIGLRQVGEIANLVQSGNTVAAGALGTKMARAMGEVGVLTDQDVSRYVVSGRLDRMAADKLSKMMRGLPSNATQAEISQISNVLRESFADKVQPIYNEYIQSFAEVEGLTPDEVSRKMSIPYTPPKLMPPPGARGQENPAQRKARLLLELQGAQ